MLSSILIARALAPAGLGELSLLQNLCLLISPLTHFGTKGNLLREIGRGEGPALLKTSNLLSIFCSLLGLVLLAPTSLFLPSHLGIIAPLCFLLHCAGESIEQKASRIYLLHICLEKEIWWSHRILILTALLKVLCAVCLANELLIPALFACGTLQSALQCLKNHTLVQKLPASLQPSTPANLTTLKTLLSESWPLTPPQILGQISKTSAPFLIASTWGNTALGIYAIALKHSIFYTLASQMLHERHLHKQTSQTALQYALLFTIPTLLTLPLIPVLYGPAFSACVLWSLCLIPTHILTVISLGHAQNLHTQNFSRLSVQKSLSSHLLTILLNLCLIPPYGLAGAVIASTLGLLLPLCLHPSKPLLPPPQQN